MPKQIGGGGGHYGNYHPYNHTQSRGVHKPGHRQAERRGHAPPRGGDGYDRRQLPAPRYRGASEDRQDFVRRVRDHRRQDAIDGVRESHDLGTARDYEIKAKTMDRGTHASTGGGYSESGKWKGTPDVHVNKEYMDRAKLDQPTYNKVVSTMRHEDVHVRQRFSKTVMTRTTKAEREFMAYAEELRDTSRFPTIEGEHREKTVEKMRNQFYKMSPAKREHYRPIYAAAAEPDAERRQSAWGRLGQFHPGNHPADILPRY